ncbi:MAG: NAD+ synthase [Candidatus Micrarchaeota archaeon]
MQKKGSFSLNAVSSAKRTERRLVNAIRAHFRSAGKSRAVLGLSGGVDSAVVCALAAKALGAANVRAYYLPYFNPPDDGRHARLAAKKFGVRLQSVSIRKTVDALVAATGARDNVSRGNIMARVRMAVLYEFARQDRALVLGTGNRTEILLGYFTKFGDGACDVLAIGGLYKAQVWQLAEILGVPSEIIRKPPSAGLWQGQTDEGELGISYSDADEILHALIDKEWSLASAKRMFGKEKVARVAGMLAASGHKRLPVPVL